MSLSNGWTKKILMCLELSVPQRLPKMEENSAEVENILLNYASLVLRKFSMLSKLVSFLVLIVVHCTISFRLHMLSVRI